MAGKSKRENVMMKSTAKLPDGRLTGEKFVATVKKVAGREKLELKRFDKAVGKHVVFKESKMPPHSK